MAQQPPPGNYPPPPGGQYPPPQGGFTPAGGPPPQGGFQQTPSGFPPPPPGAGFPPAGPPAKKGGAGKIIGAIVGVVVVLIVGAIIRFGLSSLGGSGALDAKVGDCLTNAADADDTEVVECSDSTAYYKVTSVETSPGVIDSEYCQNDAEATQFLAEGKNPSIPDTVYCIAPK